MTKIHLVLALAAMAALLLGSTCQVDVEEDGYDDRPYGEESAEEQTMDEQMDEVDEQINR